MIEAADQVGRKSSGIVSYVYDAKSDGLSARWLSSRIVHTALPGTGTAFRTAKGQGFEGEWEITYHDPDGSVSWHPFALKIARDNEVSVSSGSAVHIKKSLEKDVRADTRLFVTMQRSTMQLGLHCRENCYCQDLDSSKIANSLSDTVLRRRKKSKQRSEIRFHRYLKERRKYLLRQPADKVTSHCRQRQYQR